MQKFYSLLLLFVTSTFLSYSQEDINKANDIEGKKVKLEQFAKEIALKSSRNYQQGLNIAKEKGWTVYHIDPTGEIVSLQGVDAGGQPIYHITNYNTRSAATISTQELWPGGLTGLNLSGSSEFMTGKLGVWDGGAILETHQELAGRVIQMDSPSSLSDHSTHVAGTLIASGVSPVAKGMSFGAEQLQAWDFDDDVSEMAQAASGLLISNHSYGSIAGWRSNASRAGTTADPNWEWWGDPTVSTQEDYKFGVYNSQAQEWDNIAYYAPYYLIVSSAGNNRNNNGPDIGKPYWRRTTTGEWELVTSYTGTISNNNSYDIITTYSSAKNILTVGAVEPIPEGYKRPSDVVISSFSSYGPTDDGRIKPDIVANGVRLISSISSGTANYGSKSGTSMSSPSAAGSMFLLQEHYHKTNGTFMLSSTLKGLVCHTADDAGNVGPDFIYGWGLINMECAANTITNANGSSHIEEISLSPSESVERSFVASGHGPLVVTICWTDPEGTPVPYGPSMLNNRTPMLVNDLDLRISDGSTTFNPWVLNISIPYFAASKGDNVLDNIEQVVVENPVPGKTYTITIAHKGNLTGSNQVFSLIATGIGGSAFCSSSSTSDANSRIDGFTLNTIDNQVADACQTYRDFTNLSTQLNQGTTYPFVVRIGTCGQENSRVVKIFADWNSNGTFDEDELVATSGVISTSGNFEGSITVPQHVKPKYFSLLRVVLMETTSATEVSSCGSYEFGETQDYLVKFGYPEVDLSLKRFTNPFASQYSSNNQLVELEIENIGESAIENIDFTFDIYENSTLVQSVNQTYTGLLPSLHSDVVRLNTPFPTQPISEYSITCTAIVNGDFNSSNNTLEHNFSTTPYQEVTDITAVKCSGSSTIRLKATATGNINWYDAAVNGNIVARGSTAVTSVIPAGNMYYVGANTFSGTIGSETKDSQPWTDGTYSQSTSYPLITAYNPLVIKSATLYVGWSGKVSLWIENAQTGEVVSSTTLSVTPTRNPATSENGAPNDLSDVGAEYQLNLLIPKAGSYHIRISYEGGATLYRNNARTGGAYPYTIPNMLTISGTSAGDKYYYWLYNIKVEDPGCESQITEHAMTEADSPVVEITSTATDDSVTLDAGNPGATYLWNTGAITQSVVVTQSGAYSVVVTNEAGCSAQGSTWVTISDVNPEVILPISVYPSPASHQVFVESEHEVLVDVYNLNGVRIMHKPVLSVYHSLDVSSLPPSVYIVKVYSPDSAIHKLYKIVVR